MSQIAAAQAKAGDVTGAVQTVNTFGNYPPFYGSQKFATLLLIARERLYAGDLKGALQCANNISDEYQKAGALREIALFQANMGDVKGALTWAHNESSPYLTSFALLGAAEGVSRLRDGKKPANEAPRLP